MAHLGQDRFRVELHALHVQFAMADAHDLVELAVAGFRPCGYLETVGQGGAIDYQAVITRGNEGFGKVLNTPPSA